MALRRGLLVSLSGIDGAGKSTVAYELRDVLSSDYGIPSRYVWCKFGDHPLSRYRLSWPIELERIRKSHLSHNETKQPSTVFKLYGLALLSFHLAQILFTVRRPIQGGHAVVCDRYIFDTMVDLHQDLHVPISRIRGIFGARWIPQPDCKVLLDLEEETAFGRKTDTASVDYLRNRRTMYLDIAREYGLTVVDAGQPIEAITRFLMEQIELVRFRGEGTG